MSLLSGHFCTRTQTPQKRHLDLDARELRDLHPLAAPALRRPLLLALPLRLALARLLLLLLLAALPLPLARAVVLLDLRRLWCLCLGLLCVLFCFGYDICQAVKSNSA